MKSIAFRPLAGWLWGLLVWSVTLGSAAAADPPPASLTVATWNLEWFFDDYPEDNFSELARQQSAPNRQEWEWKLQSVAEVIAELRPTILCLQEIENRRVLIELTEHLREHHGLHYRIAYIPGWDLYTEQDVAILYQSGLVEFSRREQSRRMWDSEEFFNLQKHLFARFEWGEGDDRQELLLINVHLRATADAAPIRERQARLIHHWVREPAMRGDHVIIIGDINTQEQAGAITPGSDMAILRGKSTETPDDDFVDLHKFLPNDQRETHIAGGQLDRILVSQSLVSDDSVGRNYVFSRMVVREDLVVRGGGRDRNRFAGQYQIDRSERDVSDHYPVMAEFLFR